MTKRAAILFRFRQRLTSLLVLGLLVSSCASPAPTDTGQATPTETTEALARATTLVVTATPPPPPAPTRTPLLTGTPLPRGAPTSPPATPQPAQPEHTPTIPPVLPAPSPTIAAPAPPSPPPTAAAPAPPSPPPPTPTPPTTIAEPSAPVLCQHTVGRDVETVDGTDNYAAIKPGDTVCVEAGERGELKIRNVRGEPEKPVTFVNHGGVVTITNGGYAGIHIRNSEHVRVVGTGVSDQCGALIAPANQQCGFKIYGKSGRGVTANERTRYVEISHVEVAGSGQSAITSQTSDVPREQFTQFDTKIHHTYLHDVPNDEGIYLGSSYYPTGDDPVLKGVDVSYNLVVNTGRDGIQVGSAVENCEIHHNRVERSSQRAESDHDGGIINNKGSVCNIYNNTIVDAGENGIKLYGSGGNKVYNNLIVRPGRKASGAKGSGIVMANSNATSLSMYVWNNTIVGANGNGIRFAAEYGDHHQILNNLIVGAAGKAIDGANGKVTVSHNLTSDDPKFTDPDRGDYSLQAGSPAIDVGADLTGLGLTIDLRGRKRPQGGAFDVGAFELTSGESP